MIEPIEFEQWINDLWSNGGVLDSSPESRKLQAMMAEAVMAPEVTIMSRAAARTGVDEIQARMTLALLHAFQNSAR